MHQDKEHNTVFTACTTGSVLNSCEWDFKAVVSEESSERAGTEYWEQGGMFLDFDLPNTYFQLPLLIDYILKYSLIFYTFWPTVSVKLGSFLKISG